jgi:general secretion pathway protein C
MTPPAALADRVRRLMAPAPAGAKPAAVPQLALVLAAALIAAQLALLVWHLLPGATRRAPPMIGGTATAAGVDANEILQAHVFGAAQLSGPAGDVQVTRVPLILAGTLAVKDPTQGLAIVGETAQAGKLYAVGAVLPGGVRLREVYTDHVVLEHDGVLEMLTLPRKIGPGGAQVAGPVVSAPGNTAEPAMAESVQRLIAQGPEVIGEVLRPMPTYASGQLKGFRVYPGRDRAKFGMLGLHAGDLVTMINGVPLSDPQRGMEILRTLGSQGAAQVTVERGNVTQQLTIDAAQIANLGQNGPPGTAPAPPVEPPQQPTSD